MMRISFRYGIPLLAGLLFLLPACSQETGEKPAPPARDTIVQRDTVIRTDTQAAGGNSPIDTLHLPDYLSEGDKSTPPRDTGYTSRPQTKKFGGKASATLKEVRAAIRDGFDRVVFEFYNEVPGYQSEYIDKPARQCGSGNQVFLPGDAWLQIRMNPAQGHDDAGKATFPKGRIYPNLKNVKQLERTCDFEAELTWVIAVLSPNKYRVFELKNPPRIVVDIQHR